MSRTSLFRVVSSKTCAAGEVPPATPMEGDAVTEVLRRPAAGDGEGNVVVRVCVCNGRTSSLALPRS